MKFANMKELKEKTSSILDLTDKGENVIVTFRGKPRAVIYKLTEEDLEDYVIAKSPKIRKLLERGEKDYGEGNFKTLEDYIKERERE